MRQVIFADFYPNTICAAKQVMIPAMTSGMINMKFNGEVLIDKNYFDNIHCPNNPTVSGMPALILVDNNSNCKIIVENCAPYDVTIERNNLMGLIKIEDKQLIPLTDVIAVCADIHTKLPKIQKAKFSREEIACRCHLQFWTNSERDTLTPFSSTRTPSASTNTTWD